MSLELQYVQSGKLWDSHVSAELQFLPPHSVGACVWGLTGVLTSLWEAFLKGRSQASSLISLIRSFDRGMRLSLQANRIVVVFGRATGNR